MVKKGIHPGLGMEEYHSWKLDKKNLLEGPISCSMLKEFDANPYAWSKAGPRKETPALRTGRLYDAAITDPDEIPCLIDVPGGLQDCEILPFPDLRSKAAREWKSEKEKAGVRVLKLKERYEEIEDHEARVATYEETKSKLELAREAVFSHSVAGKMVQDADFQVGVVGDYAGVPTKCLIDILPNKNSEYCETLVDYKTTSMGLGNEAISKAFGNWAYHWQAGFYRTLFNKVSKFRLCENFAFIFQDVDTLEVRVVFLGDDALASGTRAVGLAMKRFMKCAHNGIESQYKDKADTLELMPYHAMSEDEELTRREGGFNE